MKRITCIILISVFLLFISIDTKAQVNVSAKSAIVIDCTSRRVLFEKDSYTKRGMASTTKIMTALVAIENAKLDDTVIVSPYAAGTEGSSIWLSPMEEMSVSDLLYGLLLASGNDAATALAEHTAGSEAAFSVLMNEKAAQIGAKNTHFTNPHGLNDENHYTTAYDLAIISAEAMENEMFSEIVSTKNKTISWQGSEWDRSLTNHNKLLSRYKYAIGIKTGYTKKDGRCLVSCAEKDGRRLVAVTLSAPDDWNDHINMLESCFEKYEAVRVCEKGKSAGEYINKEIEADNILMAYNDDFITSLTGDEKENIIINRVYNFDYPVYKGQLVGYAEIYCDDINLGRVDLIAENNAEIKNDFMLVIKKLAKGILKL